MFCLFYLDVIIDMAIGSSQSTGKPFKLSYELLSDLQIFMMQFE